MGFELSVKSVLLGVRVYGFLFSSGVSCLRVIYCALGEEPNRIDECLRRLCKREFVLRTREPVFEFETAHFKRRLRER